MEEQNNTGGGIEVTLVKDFTQYGSTIKAGKKITTDPQGYAMLQAGGFIENKQATDY